MRRSELVCLAVILVSFGIGISFYPWMPEMMAAHWNIIGEVDGYLPKFWALILAPSVSLGLFALFIIIPKIDPLKGNIEKFRKYYDGFVVLLICFLTYLGFLQIAWNSGINFNIIQTLALAFGVLFYYLGILTENAKRNWFIGVRTPWTLSNEEVWNKTHKLGGKLFKICGILAAFLDSFLMSLLFTLYLLRYCLWLFT